MSEQQKQFDKTALITLPKIAENSSPEKGLLSWSRPYLIDQIRQQGVDVEIARSADAIIAESGIVHDVKRPEYQTDGHVKLQHIGDAVLESYGVMRTIVRSVPVDHFVPVLNPTDLRQHARDKHDASVDILSPAGAYKRQSNLIAPGDDIANRLDALPGNVFVAKPSVGRLSRGVKVGSRAEIYDHIATQEIAHLVEEKINFSAALPSIKGIDEEQQARLNEANRLGVNKELRMYYFGNGVWDSILRVAKPHETDFSSDEWLYIDLDSIPDEIYKTSISVIERIKERVGTDEINIALDFVYGSTASEPEPHWEVMEMNVNEPQLVQIHENGEIGRRQHKKLATQIARIAVS